MRPTRVNIRGRGSHAMGQESSSEALQSMLTGEYTEESTGARTIRQTGGKDRHSKVFTSRGPRDRRVRLSVATAIRFYDLQDRLGFEQPSKAVEWLLLHCQPSIKALPQLGSFHRQQTRITTLSAPQPHAHLSDYPPRHIPTMDVKSSHGNAIHYKSMHNQYQFDHKAQLASLQQCTLPSDNLFLDTPSFFYDAHQSTVDEGPSHSSNPSSSGGSSDHATSLCKTEPTISTQAGILHPSPPCFSVVNIHHALADNYSASFTAESNAAANGNRLSEEQQRSGTLALSKRLLGASNMMSHQDDYSVIGSNTGKMYGNSSSASFSLNGNCVNMGINAPLTIRQTDFVMDASTQTDVKYNMQLMTQMPTSGILNMEPSNYVQPQQWQAQTNDGANEEAMSLQGVQGGSLPDVHMEDTLRLYEKNMGLCGARNIVSPSESNNTSVVPAAINYSNRESYSRPSFDDWALKHALL